MLSLILAAVAHICCAKNWVKAAFILLEHGADFESDIVRNLDGKTPLELALAKGHTMLVQAIRSRIAAELDVR